MEGIMAAAPAQAESTSRSLSPGKLGLAACTALVSGSDENLHQASGSPASVSTIRSSSSPTR